MSKIIGLTSHTKRKRAAETLRAPDAEPATSANDRIWEALCAIETATFEVEGLLALLETLVLKWDPPPELAGDVSSICSLTGKIKRDLVETFAQSHSAIMDATRKGGVR